MWFVPRGIRFTDAIRIERIGATPFVEAGSVAGNADGLFNAPVRGSYGIGLRLMLERTAVFRADFGFSEEDFNFALKFGMPF